MSRITNYDLNKLKNYLIKNSDYEELTLSLDEIEDIIGGKLPEFSYKKDRYCRFWYNDCNNNHSYAPYWMTAGFYARCDINQGIVTFSKEFERKQKKKSLNKASCRFSCDFDVNLAIEAIKKYHYSTNSNFTRYKSWEHCYNAFRMNRHDESKIDFLCLHLSCYLASWGMLRNSALINYDYLIHKDFVKNISDFKYDKLYDEDFNDVDFIFELVDLINSSYPSDVSKTDTFVTKILLGVFGCVPAYDRYFRHAVSNCKVCSRNFSKNSLKNLYAYYELHFDDFEKLRHQFIGEGVYYTPMKMIDMCFWQLGFDMENK